MKFKGVSELDRVRAWLEGPGRSPWELGPRAADLLKSLREAEGGEPEPAIEVARDFVRGVEERWQGAIPFEEREAALICNVLLSLLVEAGQYRHESFAGDPARAELYRSRLLPAMAVLRNEVRRALEGYLSDELFRPIGRDLREEVFPLVERLAPEGPLVAHRRFMPFRVSLVGEIYERLRRLRLRTSDERLAGSETAPGLLRAIYAGKYLRFGTSGVRGRWSVDFTEESARRITQAICDYLAARDLPDRLSGLDLRGRIIVVGYDSRRHAARVAEWIAEVCLGNGFRVHMVSRDTPTPALAYYLSEVLGADEVAGSLNCTASHNPPEWQGIKFSPREGFPAPTSITDLIAARANEIYLQGQGAARAHLPAPRRGSWFETFDPSGSYLDWLLMAGESDRRISVEPERIREFVAGRTVLVDEMFGATRGYLGRLLGAIGVRHIVLRGERDEDLGGLAYANPEYPFIEPLASAVAADPSAVLGLAMDTDGDRFGVVDHDGTYYRPNQIIPMLVRYLGVDRGLEGRVVATQTGSPMLEELASRIPYREEDRPIEGAIPAYVDHPFYELKVGDRSRRVYRHVFMVPVGIKYIEEQRRTDRDYRLLRDLPPNWRDTLLLGGEESSGLTTRGHITDKDGIWANLLILDMVAYYGKSLKEIWGDTVRDAGAEYYGGLPGSTSGRQDLDATLEVKERFINSFLDRFDENPDHRLAGLQVVYAGGVRFDLAEIELEDDKRRRHYLRVRASGTEPINRVYVESSDPEVAKALQRFAVEELERFSREAIETAESEWRLAEILSASEPRGHLVEVVRELVESRPGWSGKSLVEKLETLRQLEERRNREIVDAWVRALASNAR